jgi:hypothetical protein
MPLVLISHHACTVQEYMNHTPCLRRAKMELKRWTNRKICLPFPQKLVCHFFIDNGNDLRHMGLFPCEKLKKYLGFTSPKDGECVFLRNSKRKDVVIMVCTTVKKGVECIFMSKRGCQFNGGSCHPIVDQCHGCQRIAEYPTGRYCMSFPDPAIKWKNGVCNMATHMTSQKTAENHKLNPLKASKRSH